MANPIPNFDHNGVVPPHRGTPTIPADLSPYPCTSRDLCERFATSPERVTILAGYLDFRERLESVGLRTGYQWLDGSFLEDIEAREKRPPKDLDVVTVYWAMAPTTQAAIHGSFREFSDPPGIQGGLQTRPLPLPNRLQPRNHCLIHPLLDAAFCTQSIRRLEGHAQD